MRNIFPFILSTLFILLNYRQALDEIRKRSLENTEMIRELPEKIALKVGQMMDDKLADHGVGGDSSQPLTMATAQALIIKPMETLIKESMAQLVQPQPQPAPGTMTPAGYFDPVAPPQDGYSWGGVHGRPIPRGFALTKLVVGRQALTTRRVGLSVIQGWRYWMLGNKVAGTDRVPVGPYRDIAPSDLWGPTFKQTRKLRTEWACVFKYLEGQLDQCLPAWRAAGPMARSTLGKVRSLLTFREAKAGVDPKNMKITYAALLVRKRLKEAAVAAAAEAEGQMAV